MQEPCHRRAFFSQVCNRLWAKVCEVLVYFECSEAPIRQRHKKWLQETSAFPPQLEGERGRPSQHVRVRLQRAALAVVTTRMPTKGVSQAPDPRSKVSMDRSPIHGILTVHSYVCNNFHLASRYLRPSDKRKLFSGGFGAEVFSL